MTLTSNQLVVYFDNLFVAFVKTGLTKMSLNIWRIFLMPKGGGQKKSCNIVTTSVHLPTYPYWCTEGNFLNFSVAKATLESQMSVRQSVHPSISLSVTKPPQPLRIAPIDYRAYQPLSLLTIKPIGHYICRLSDLLLQLLSHFGLSTLVSQWHPYS